MLQVVVQQDVERWIGQKRSSRVLRIVVFEQLWLFQTVKVKVQLTSLWMKA